MAFIPSLSVLLHPIMLRTPIALVGLSISMGRSSYDGMIYLPMLLQVVHEVMLQRTSLEVWALGPHRHSLLSQNKEGITSLIGGLDCLHVK